MTGFFTECRELKKCRLPLWRKTPPYYHTSSHEMQRKGSRHPPRHVQYHYKLSPGCAGTPVTKTSGSNTGEPVMKLITVCPAPSLLPRRQRHRCNALEPSRWTQERMKKRSQWTIAYPSREVSQRNLAMDTAQCYSLAQLTAAQTQFSEISKTYQNTEKKLPSTSIRGKRSRGWKGQAVHTTALQFEVI